MPATHGIQMHQGLLELADRAVARVRAEIQSLEGRIEISPCLRKETCEKDLLRARGLRIAIRHGYFHGGTMSIEDVAFLGLLAGED